ncbi:YoaK family protein [Paracoccus seriniphilus]|uniref:YoaK family protein n=1 Tax=Paracoccus seriniphilus TaxID=184748 RepID=UPI0035649794
MKRKLIYRPAQRARALVGLRRSPQSDLSLATLLAFVAGALNAGGFFALGQYTSHMTGYLSQLADNLVILNFRIAFVAALAISSFVAGAGFSTILINWTRRYRARQQYALPLALQGIFLVCFAGGGIFASEAGRLFSLACLCFIMGMQNATITKISRARIRTTHATGMITDIGIELGRGIYGAIMHDATVFRDTRNLMILARLVLSFLLGGIIGALGFGHMRFLFALPLASLLLVVSLPALFRQTWWR